MSDSKQVAVWLFICAFFVFLMVIIGGLTRLTESGLSIVEWRPVTGAIPPISEEDWKQEFDKYRSSPEFKKKNKNFELDNFKNIFWLEYIHRLLGRIIGFVFLFPLFYFLLRRKISFGIFLKLAAIFVLGGVQGFMGWYMVKSGLVNDPAVSHYRLALHLGLAFIIFALIFWLALKNSVVGSQRSEIRGNNYCHPEFILGSGSRTKFGMTYWLSWGITFLIFIQTLLGALVAGLDAGLIYNSFPLMGSGLIPEEAYKSIGSIFEDHATVQANHRFGAYILTLAMVIYTIYCYKIFKKLNLLKYLLIQTALFVIQFLLGVVTLIYQVPLVFASLHQSNAMILFAISLFINFRLYVIVRQS